MIHVSILVPSASAVQESVESVFTILDQANDHALARGDDTIFDIHLVGTTDRVDLYGGHCSVTPDLPLAETVSTDLVIVPSLAGNIAEGLRLNAAFIPWMRAQYHAGAEVAGLCTAALFIADTGLVGDARCSPHWFVDAAFRKEFSYIGLIVDRTTPDERAISGTGAYSFFHRVLERTGAGEVASLCAASSEAAFNQQCQSVLTAVDEVARAARVRRRIGTPVVEDGGADDEGGICVEVRGQPPGAQWHRRRHAGEPDPHERFDAEAPHQARARPGKARATVSLNGRSDKRRTLVMAKRKARVMSDKEALKHYTPYEDAPPGSSNPTFIKAVVAVDPVLTGRKSAVIEIPGSKSQKRRERKHGKKNE